MRNPLISYTRGCGRRPRSAFVSILALHRQQRSHPPLGLSVSIPSGKRKFNVKQSATDHAIVTNESGAVSLLLLLLARAGVFNPGSLCIYQGPACFALALFACLGTK